MSTWDDVQRQGHDIAGRFASLAQGLGCILQSRLGSPVPSPSHIRFGFQASNGECGDEVGPSWHWPWIVKPRSKSGFGNSSMGKLSTADFSANGADDGGGGDDDDDLKKSPLGQDSVGLEELRKRLGHAGSELGSCIGSFVNQFTKGLIRISHDEIHPRIVSQPNPLEVTDCEEDYLYRAEPVNTASCSVSGPAAIKKRTNNSRHRRSDELPMTQKTTSIHDCSNEELFGLFINRQSQLYRQGSVNVATTYNSRTQEIESSVTARGDLWRAEASHGRSSSTNGSSPLFLLQIGPLLFVRDSTLLLPIHLSKQHLLWYGFDRKNGLHSICPAVWSRRRRWSLMSMICLNPFTCSFMDLQFPNGQLTYVAGEGVTSSAFFPLLGGLLQAQCAHPDVFKLSFSKKLSWGTRVTPSLQLPERSVSLDVLQPMVWQRSGMIVRPTIEMRVTPTIGGRNAGWKAEFVHSPKERLKWACGCAFTLQPTAYASISISNAKRSSDDLGRAGLVLRVEAPIENLSQASFQVQLNSGVEF